MSIMQGNKEYLFIIMLNPYNLLHNIHYFLYTSTIIEKIQIDFIKTIFRIFNLSFSQYALIV